jgi:uncharacterized protein (DUF488 family)
VRVFSIGHGARAVGELVVTLHEAGVRRLFDVRTRPGSRRHPQFGRVALTETLEAAGIGYAWEADLGGFRHARQDSANTALPPDGFRGYADHMATATFRRALGRLTEAAAREPAAVMCAETRWERCHRRFVADALTVGGMAVTHLIGPGEAEPHELHPALSVRDGILVYESGSDQPTLDLH